LKIRRYESPCGYYKILSRESADINFLSEAISKVISLVTLTVFRCSLQRQNWTGDTVHKTLYRMPIRHGRRCHRSLIFAQDNIINWQESVAQYDPRNMRSSLQYLQCARDQHHIHIFLFPFFCPTDSIADSSLSEPNICVCILCSQFRAGCFHIFPIVEPRARPNCKHDVMCESRDGVLVNVMNIARWS